MYIGTGLIHLHIPGSRSLKDKRQVIRSLTQRVRNRFTVAIAEVGDNEAWQSAALGFACVSNEHAHAERICQEVLEFIEDSDLEFEVVGRRLEVLKVED
ncbi:MAG: DUF503 domain-containing protein [Dehalococcoidia bacterium]